MKHSKTSRPSIIAQREHSLLTGQRREAPMSRSAAPTGPSRPGSTFGNRIVAPAYGSSRGSFGEAARLFAEMREAAIRAERRQREHDCGAAAVGGFCPHGI